MYCYHCGYKIDEHKLEAKSSSYNPNEEVDTNTQVQYICPRCGHLIHADMSESDVKSLSRASHAQVQRGANSFAIGMSFNVVGLIALVLGILFYFLAKKPGKGFVLQTTCAEFYVFIVLTTIAVILLVLGIVNTIRGVKTKKHYSQLLKDINNKTFVQ